LPSGGASSGTVKTRLPLLSPGRYYIVAVANIDGNVAEVDRTNNVRVTSVIAGADIVVASAATSRAVSPGSNVSVTTTLRNQGGAASDPIQLDYRLSSVSISDRAITLAS